MGASHQELPLEQFSKELDALINAANAHPLVLDKIPALRPLDQINHTFKQNLAEEIAFNQTRSFYVDHDLVTRKQQLAAEIKVVDDNNTKRKIARIETETKMRAQITDIDLQILKISAAHTSQQLNDILRQGLFKVDIVAKINDLKGKIETISFWYKCMCACCKPTQTNDLMNQYQQLDKEYSDAINNLPKAKLDFIETLNKERAALDAQLRAFQEQKLELESADNLKGEEGVIDAQIELARSHHYHAVQRRTAISLIKINHYLNNITLTFEQYSTPKIQPRGLFERTLSKSGLNIGKASPPDSSKQAKGKGNIQEQEAKLGVQMKAFQQQFNDIKKRIADQFVKFHLLENEMFVNRFYYKFLHLTDADKEKFLNAAAPDQFLLDKVFNPAITPAHTGSFRRTPTATGMPPLRL